MSLILPNDFITSDYHFGHARVIEYSHRPFKDVDEMNEILIKNWNEKVPINGKVYFLGDFCFNKNIEAIRKRLNGSICLIKGNHDKNIKGDIVKLFEWVKDYYEADYINEEGIKIKVIMCHYPFLTWNKAHFGSWCLHGHSHGSLKDDGSRRIDIGIDTNPKYEPWSFKEIEKKMLDRKYIKVDHHDERNKE